MGWEMGVGRWEFVVGSGQFLVGSGYLNELILASAAADWGKQNQELLEFLVVSGQFLVCSGVGSWE